MSNDLRERDAVAVIMHQPDVHLGRFEDLLDARGIRRVHIEAWSDDLAAVDLGAVGGIISLGGEMGAHEHERYSFIRSEIALLESAHRGGIPILGLCLGGQLLARALGSPLRPGCCREIGWFDIDFVADDPLLGPPGPRKEFQWHYDAFEVPPDGELVGRGTAWAPQAFRHGASYGIQFHPEVSRAALRYWTSSPQGRAELEELDVDIPSLLAQATEFEAEQQRQAARIVDGFAALVSAYSSRPSTK